MTSNFSKLKYTTKPRPDTAATFIFSFPDLDNFRFYDYIHDINFIVLCCFKNDSIKNDKDR